MDRISPTKRPPREADGTQKWRDLLFLHYEVPVSALRALVPPSLELDLWQGKALVGVVPFAMLDVKPKWAPVVPGVSHFLELNVRAYVSVGEHPGVYFFSLEAESSVAVLAARAGWGLPYFRARMQLERERDLVRYSSERLFPPPTPARLEASYRVGPRLPDAEPGSLEFFLAERYLLFTAEGEGDVKVGQVYHTPYPLYEATLLSCEQSMLAAAGLPASCPVFSTHYSPGVDVEVFGLVPPSELRLAGA
jgi:uncharacterized protein YqjF (DUF2071 family)